MYFIFKLTAQLVDHCTNATKVMGLNPIPTHINLDCTLRQFPNSHKYVADVTWWVVHVHQHGYCVADP